MKPTPDTCPCGSSFKAEYGACGGNPKHAIIASARGYDTDKRWYVCGKHLPLYNKPGHNWDIKIMAGWNPLRRVK